MILLSPAEISTLSDRTPWDALHSYPDRQPITLPAAIQEFQNYLNTKPYLNQLRAECERRAALN